MRKYSDGTVEKISDSLKKGLYRTVLSCQTTTFYEATNLTVETMRTGRRKQTKLRKKEIK